MCDNKKSSDDMLQEIVQLAGIFQANLNNIPLAILKTKYEQSWKDLVRNLSNCITAYLLKDMHKKIPNLAENEKELYIQFLQELLRTVNGRYSLAVKKLPGEILKRSLIEIQTEVLKKEKTYCMERFALANVSLDENKMVG